MKINIAYDLLPKRPTAHTALVMSQFGIGFDAGPHVIADGVELPIRPGDIVCFTGDSGSGKSSLLRAAAGQLENVVTIDALSLGDACLIDGLGVPFAEALRRLSVCGLSDARLLLRTPAELSDGERYRYRLAAALARRPAWLVADEFTSSLDRPLAKVIAFNLAKVARRERIGLLLATTHRDIVEDLAPDLDVTCELGGGIDWTRRAVEKKVSASPVNSRSPPVPSRTGRTSLGGITATRDREWSGS